MKHRSILVGSCLALLITSRVLHAQSVWNTGAADWFTPGNWTPSGVPTSSIDAQVNNGGTAQITTANAAAKSLTLGTGVGDSGTVSVSGPGTLTVNNAAGFFLTVGSSGTGTLNVSAGGTVVDAPILYIGDKAGAVGTVTVTGVGSSITAQFQVEVGRSGTGTLNILDGATFTATGAAFAIGDGTGTGHVKVDGTTANLTTLATSGFNIGGGTLGGAGDVTVTGAKAKFTATGTVDVGSAGDGTLIMSAGATGTATALLIGDAGTGTTTLTDAGTSLTVTAGAGKVTVGNTTTGNLNIQAGAKLSSLNGVVGQNPGGTGTVTITGPGSTWTITNTNGLSTGQSGLAGGTATINVSNGGKLAAPNLNAYTATTIKVDGAGSQLSLPNDSGATPHQSLYLGTVGVNELDVTNGGKLTTGSTQLTTTAGTSLTINLAGTGSNWIATPLVGTLTTQFGGAGTASFTVDDHATFTYAANGFFNVDTTGAGTASLTVKNGAVFDVGTTSTLLRIGQDGTGSLIIASGGTVNTAHAYIGENTGAVGTATVSGVGTVFNANDLQVGTLGGQGTVSISGGAALKGDASIGGATGGGQLTLTDAGTTWTISPTSVNNFVSVKGHGTLNILAGAVVTGGPGSANISAGATGQDGTILIDGNGTKVNLATLFTDGTGTITIRNKAVVSGATAVLGQNEGAVTTVTVDGVGTQWNMTGNPQIGNRGKATLNVQSGAAVTSGRFLLGYNNNADNTGGNGIVNVTGAGSSVTASSYLRVADYYFTSGALTISQGGTVSSVSGGTPSTLSGLASTNNANGSILVTDATSSWTNTGNVYIGKDGTTGVGTVTVANSGAIHITGAVSINATSTLNIGNGGTAGSFSATSLANSGLLHFNYTDSFIYSTPTSGTGALAKDGTGTLILTGTHAYTGATTINGGALLVNGSLGNTATVVNNGGTLGGAGTIGGGVTLNNNSALLPGAAAGTVGTLGTGTTTVNGGAKLVYELSTPGVVGGAANDLTEVTGDLNLNGGVLNINGLAGFGIGTYRIFDYTGSLLGSALTIGSAPMGYLYTIDTSTLQEVNLIVAGGGPLPIAYFNGSHLTPNGMVNGGSGVWDNSTTNWTDAHGNVFGTWGGGVGFFAGAPGTIILGSEVNFTALQFSTDGYVIKGAGFALNGTGQVVITTDPGVGATIDTIIRAPGGVTKNGAGSLFLDGSLFGNLTVRQGLLGGHGSIFGDLLNAAIVSPGHSPGQLKVSGNYTQTPTGLLKIEIGGRSISEHDLLTVGGAASLDGTLQLVRLNHFKLKRNKPVTFLTAAGGVDGEFADLITDFTSDTILRPTVVYHPNSVALEAVPGRFTDLAGLTPNQKAVARSLDSAAHDKRADALFEYLDYRKLTKLPGDLDKIAPEELTSVFTIGTSLAAVQSGNIQRRTDDIRSGANGFNAANLAVNGDGPQYSGSFRTGVAGPNGSEIRDDGKEVKETKEIAPVEENRWGVFLSGNGEWVSAGDTNNARGYDLTSGGFTLGLDYKVTPNLAVGLAAGYIGTTADLTDRGRAYVNGGKLGLYATYFEYQRAAPAPGLSKDSKEVPAPSDTVIQGFYADVAVFGGYNSYDFHRSALQGQARGDTDGGELNVLAGIGYDFKRSNLTFGPTASFNYTYLGIRDFTEHGSLAPLNIHGGKGESLRTAFGFKVSYDWRVGGVLIKPEIRAAWQHEFGDAAYALDSDFAHDAGDSFRVNGPEFGRDSALLGAGFAIQFNERLSTYFYYDGELGRRNYQSSSVTGGFRLAF